MNFQLQTMVPEEKAKSFLRNEEAQGVEPLKFTKVHDYTTFDAEYAIVGDDIVFHFFLPDDIEHLARSQQYWKGAFPAALDTCAQEHWGATYPRLQAAFTEELNSWWLRCFGFANIGDPEARIKKFFDKLDKQIDKGRG